MRGVFVAEGFGDTVDDRSHLASNAVPRHPIIDVSTIPIDELVGSGDTNVARCIERLVAGLVDRDGVISAFQSFASES